MKKRLIISIVMLILGAGVYAASIYDCLLPAPVQTAADAATPSEAAAVRSETAAAIEEAPSEHETDEITDTYEPSPLELNLAHVFPEDVDQNDLTKSLAGNAFHVLMTQDETWMSGIYDYSDFTPLQLASRLGRSKEQVMGSYNPEDRTHDPADPDTWTVNAFKDIRMDVTNGDGTPISVYSNVIEIMSMANVYTYYHNSEDLDLFLDYARSLWKASHSYSVSVSDVYYCQGCLDEEGSQRELEALEAAARAEAEGRVHEDGTMISEESDAAAPQTASAGPGASDAEQSSSEDSPDIEASGSPVVVASQKQRSETAPEETETEPVPTAGIILAGQTRLEQPSSDETSASEGESENTPPGGPVSSEADTASASDAGEASDHSVTVGEADHSATAKAVSSQPSQCPGHIDLIIRMKIHGLEGGRGLFAVDSVGNDTDRIQEDGWPGWNEETIGYVKQLKEQDWFQKYGLSVSVISMRNPLNSSEIEAYMNELPEGISQTRRDIIRFALSSVGRVPYHWGGKANRPNYVGNNFGALTSPDEKGRVLKGLDCSGWINWVYWSATGSRLPYESTSGLALCGTRIRRDELQPGDIIIRTGGDAHVIMFLGWTEDGRIRCIHESSANVNNVTISIRDANWPYYIRLVE